MKIAFAMFGVYVMLDDRNVLDAQKVFVSMALINILKTPLSQLPFAISTTMQVGGAPLHDSAVLWLSLGPCMMMHLFQAMVSLRRLGKYLCSDELKADNVSKAPLTSGNWFYKI